MARECQPHGYIEQKDFVEYVVRLAEALELRKVLHAFRKVSIDDLTSIDSEKQEHSSQVGVMSKVTVKNAERLPARHAGLYYKPRQCRGFFMRRRLGWITASCWAIAWTL